MIIWLEWQSGDGFGRGSLRLFLFRRGLSLIFICLLHNHVVRFGVRLHQCETMLRKTKQVCGPGNGNPRIHVHRILIHLALYHVSHHTTHYRLEFKESAQHSTGKFRVLRSRRNPQSRSIKVLFERDDDQVGLSLSFLLHPAVLHDRRPRSARLIQWLNKKTTTKTIYLQLQQKELRR